jgi:hypothetical protein
MFWIEHRNSPTTAWWSMPQGGVRPSPLDTLATIWPIVPAPDDRWWWMFSSWWNENWQGKPKYSEKTCPSTILSTTNPTWRILGSNPDHHSGKLATNCLSYGMAWWSVSLFNDGATSEMFSMHSILSSDLEIEQEVQMMLSQHLFR